MNNLANKRIVLGVSGSIAAYKSPDIVRRLQDLGAELELLLLMEAENLLVNYHFKRFQKIKFMITSGIKKQN